jgi:hypothetical protein
MQITTPRPQVRSTSATTASISAASWASACTDHRHEREREHDERHVAFYHGRAVGEVGHTARFREESGPAPRSRPFGAYSTGADPRWNKRMS